MAESGLVSRRAKVPKYHHKRRLRRISTIERVSVCVRERAAQNNTETSS